MVPVIKQLSNGLAVLAVTLGAGGSVAQPATPTPNPRGPTEADAALPATPAPKPPLTRAEGMLMLDYQVVPVAGGKSIDLMGSHLLNKMNDGM